MNTNTNTNTNPNPMADVAADPTPPIEAAAILPFTASQPFTMGIELELQLLNRRNYNLATDAVDLLAWIEPRELQKQIKLEMTQGMIELNSDIHTRVDHLVQELKVLRASLLSGAQYLNIGVAGGGAHPFQRWSEQRITPGERFLDLHSKYGYLAKTFTVFGQHIHIGVPNGDDAMYLTHAFSRFVPHFIALSAASPFYQGIDTAFDSSRSNVVSAFPLSGTAPLLTRWSEFEAYYDKLLKLGVVTSMKDFYWDIRPKPEYGTVEIRVCDTPLTIEHAALLGCYAQLLARWLLTERPLTITPDFYLLYPHNRFQASRYGLRGEIISQDQNTPTRQLLSVAILERFDDLKRYTENDAELLALRRLRNVAYEQLNDAGWLRQTFAHRESLSDVMRLSSDLWMTRTGSPFLD